jgi:hypothetical protein
MADETRVEFSGYTGAPRIFMNGVWGGPLTPDLLIMHCLFKHVTPPENLTLDAKSGQQVGHEGVIDTNEVMATIIIQAEEAISIGKWMIRHGEDMMKKNKGQSVPEGMTVQ